MAQTRHIEGTPVFDGGSAMKGYQLNKMCFSFNDPENRKAFLAGGNAYYLAKLAGMLGLNVQDIGAQQTGMTVEAFKQKLLDQARQ